MLSEAGKAELGSTCLDLYVGKVRATPRPAPGSIPAAGTSYFPSALPGTHHLPAELGKESKKSKEGII